MSRIRTLFLGVNIDKTDVQRSFDPNDAPSLFDFDIAIIDPDFSLNYIAEKYNFRLGIDKPLEVRSNDGMMTLLRTFNEKLREDTSLHLEKGGLLVCLLRPPKGFEYTIHSRDGDNTYYETNYDWVPIKEISKNSFWTISRGKGDRIIVSDKPNAFTPFLKMKQTHWEAYLSNQRGLDDIGVLAMNDGERPVSFELGIEKGWIVFLPVSTHEKFGEILLDCTTRYLTAKKIHARPPPEWLKSIETPGEQAISKVVVELNGRIEALENERNKNAQKLQEMTEIKKLLYEGDEVLENAVKKAFEEIGFKLSKKDDMDWVSASAEKGAILEVTGCENTIDIDKLRQLLNYLLNDYIETRKEKKAILVGNHFINDPIESRGDPFTEKVIKEADTHSICLLTTVDLFKAICSIRESKLAAEAVQKRIMETTGICKIL